MLLLHALRSDLFSNAVFDAIGAGGIRRSRNHTTA
jgi:hypothetical protein